MCGAGEAAEVARGQPVIGVAGIVLGLGVTVAEPVGLVESVADDVPVALSVGVGVGVPESVAEGVGVAEAVTVGLAGEDGVGVAVGCGELGTPSGEPGFAGGSAGLPLAGIAVTDGGGVGTTRPAPCEYSPSTCITSRT